jgi:hypothetical protein
MSSLGESAQRRMVYLSADHDSRFNVDGLIVQSAEPMFVLDAGIVDLDHD